MAEESNDFENMDLGDFDLDSVTLEKQSSSNEISEDDGIRQAFSDVSEDPLLQETVSSPFQTEEVSSKEQNDQVSYDAVNESEDVIKDAFQDDVSQQTEEEFVSEKMMPDKNQDYVAEQVSVPEQEELSRAEDNYPMEEDNFIQEAFTQGTEGSSGRGLYTQIEESHNVGFLKWYSGTSTENMFEIKKGFEPGRFEADEDQKSIHINAGYDTYGWSVQFADGVVMNLHDVREYQIRNGRLPYQDGRIIYGKDVLEFVNIERIVVYESVKYFSYGV